MTLEELDEYYDYDNILNRMLNNIEDSIDKREGSVIYNAIAPVALELAQMYFILSNSINLCFADTAVESYLDSICNQAGVYRRKATNAIRMAKFFSSDLDEHGEYLLLDVNIGERFSVEDIIFIVTEKIQDGIYKIECETAGTIGNNCTGALIPVGYIENLSAATILDILIPGQDEETDEKLRARYFETINEKVFAGNIADYKKQTKSISGVGAVKVTPIWNGGGTVKLTILDSEYNRANNTLIEKVQNEICPNLSSEGLGLAPIGHQVTVDTVENYELSLSANVSTTEGISLEQIRLKVEEKVKEYLLELRKNWENINNIIIRKAQIEARMLNIDGIIDIANVTLNLEMSNIELNAMQVPVLKEVHLL